MCQQHWQYFCDYTCCVNAFVVPCHASPDVFESACHASVENLLKQLHVLFEGLRIQDDAIFVELNASFLASMLEKMFLDSKFEERANKK